MLSRWAAKSGLEEDGSRRQNERLVLVPRPRLLLDVLLLARQRRLDELHRLYFILTDQQQR